MFTKTDATSLAVVPGTDFATWSLKLILHLSPAAVSGTKVASCSLKLMLHP
jgi:hypothetical protein